MASQFDPNAAYSDAPPSTGGASASAFDPNAAYSDTPPAAAASTQTGALGIGKVPSAQEIAALAPKPSAPPTPIQPPQDHREELVNSLAGSVGLSLYREARTKVSQVEDLLKPDNGYAHAKQAVTDFGSGLLKTAKTNVTLGDYTLNPETNPVKAQPIMPGPGVAGALENADAELMAGRAGATVLVKNPWAGSKVASQEAAASTVRGAAGVAPGTSILKGAETAVDAPLSTVGVAKDAAYGQIDKTVGFDLKDAKDRLDATEYAIQQPGADKVVLQQDIDELTPKIAEANKKLAAAGIDPKVADRLNTSWQAGNDFKKLLVRASNPDGTMNIKTMLTGSKSLRFSKYGDRLAQFFGKGGGDITVGKTAADAYMADLDAAQKEGQTELSHQKFMADVKKYLAYTAATAVVGAGAVETAKHFIPTKP